MTHEVPVTATIQRRRVNLATGVGLDVLVGGAPGSPPVIFLHGFPESARTWLAQLKDLARDHRVAAPDQRGYAWSDKPPAVGDYHIRALVADVVALADALGFGRFALAGHDWGGAVAWATALKHPARVSRLIVANGPHPHVYQARLFSDPDQRAASRYMIDYRRPDAAVKLIERGGLEGFFDRRFAIHFDEPVSPSRRRAYLREWSQPGAFRAMLNWYQASSVIVPAQGDESHPPDWLGWPFPKTEMPVLVIWGERDKALLAAQLDDLAQHVPDLSIVRLNAGHFVTWEAPEAVGEAIRGFLT